MSRREQRRRRETQERKSKKLWPFYALLVLAVTGLFLGSLSLIQSLSQRSQASEECERAASYAPNPSEQEYIRGLVENADFLNAEQGLPVNLPLMSFEGLQSQNSDVWGWICIFGTDINSPVVKGDKDYTQYSFFGRKSSFGCPFVSTYEDYSDGFHHVIYGSNAGKMMFGELNQCCEEEKVFGVLYTPQKTYALYKIASYQTTADSGYDQVVFQDENAKRAFVNSIWEKDTSAASVSYEQLGMLLTLATPKNSISSDMTAVVFQMVE